MGDLEDAAALIRWAVIDHYLKLKQQTDDPIWAKRCASQLHETLLECLIKRRMTHIPREES